MRCFRTYFLLHAMLTSISAIVWSLPKDCSVFTHLPVAVIMNARSGVVSASTLLPILVGLLGSVSIVRCSLFTASYNFVPLSTDCLYPQAG
uniref:Uncharacterized protein n=1 Tax=Ixodes ricinus TaxID=34613 RepID=A0A6B0U186_IXORI